MLYTVALLEVCMILQCKEVPYCILLGISCWISISGLPFGSAIPAPPSTQDLHCDGEGGQTHRMGNNTSLLGLPTEFGTQQLGKPVLQDQQKIWLVNILLPYDCMQVQAFRNILIVSW